MSISRLQAREIATRHTFLLENYNVEGYNFCPVRTLGIPCILLGSLPWTYRQGSVPIYSEAFNTLYEEWKESMYHFPTLGQL